MCDDPIELPDGVIAACRKCELCRYNRVKDWAGRHIAQSKVSAASFACTLTYGPELDAKRMPIAGRKDHIRTAVLTYSDVQKFLKYLRSHLGYACDFMVTGELGGLKSRTHWHIILHFRDRVPSHELGVNFSDRHVNERGKLYQHEVCKAWPHGFMFWKKAVFEDVFYNCKYMLKDEADEASQRKPQMSKKPPIGAAYFERLADLHVKQHVAPQSLEYKFPEIKKKDGSPLIFLLKGRTAEIYLERFISRWKEVHGDKRRPVSQLVDLFEEYGKVVVDEARMLSREAFPKGESKERFPSGQQIKAWAEEARTELEQWRGEQWLLDRDGWQDSWIREAKDVEEQQKREIVVEFERREQEREREQEHEQFVRYKQRHGWSFVVGQGWQRTRPGTGGDETFVQWRQRQSSQLQRGGEHGIEQGGRLGSVLLGKTGRWNQAYGTGETVAAQKSDTSAFGQSAGEAEGGSEE